MGVQTSPRFALSTSGKAVGASPDSTKLPLPSQRSPTGAQPLFASVLLVGAALAAMTDSSSTASRNPSCGRCGIAIHAEQGSGDRAPVCSGHMEQARRDSSWPFFPLEAGGCCQLCGEGGVSHRGLRTHVAGGLYCNAHDQKVDLCCNCGIEQGVSFFFDASCPYCLERRQLPSALAPGGGKAERHLVILCHGLYGLPSELYAARDKLRAVPGCFVHCCESYAGSGTKVGIDEIAELIVEEVRSVIDWSRSVIDSSQGIDASQRPALSTISFIGHSLGGVIARSAISKLYDADDKTIAGLRPLVFVSTASPHCGITNYGPLPRLPVALTAPLASIFAGKTGRDLFSIDAPSGIVRQLATDAAALEALQSFSSRRMYALKSGDMLVGFERSCFQTPETFLRRKHRTYTTTATSTTTSISSTAASASSVTTTHTHTHTVTFHESLPEAKSTCDLGVPWAAALEDLGWEKVMVEFDCGMPPNGHRKLVANHKDGLRDDREGNLVMDDLASFVALAVARAAVS